MKEAEAIWAVAQLHQPTSREVAEYVGKSVHAAGAALLKLHQEGLVVREKETTDAPGRPAYRYELAPSAASQEAADDVVRERPPAVHH